VLSSHRQPTISNPITTNRNYGATSEENEIQENLKNQSDGKSFKNNGGKFIQSGQKSSHISLANPPQIATKSLNLTKPKDESIYSQKLLRHNTSLELKSNPHAFKSSVMNQTNGRDAAPQPSQYQVKSGAMPTIGQNANGAASLQKLQTLSAEGVIANGSALSSLTTANGHSSSQANLLIQPQGQQQVNMMSAVSYMHQ